MATGGNTRDSYLRRILEAEGGIALATMTMHGLLYAIVLAAGGAVTSPVTRDSLLNDYLVAKGGTRLVGTRDEIIEAIITQLGGTFPDNQTRNYLLDVWVGVAGVSWVGIGDLGEFDIAFSTRQAFWAKSVAEPALTWRATDGTAGQLGFVDGVFDEAGYDLASGYGELVINQDYTTWSGGAIVDGTLLTDAVNTAINKATTNTIPTGCRYTEVTFQVLQDDDETRFPAFEVTLQTGGTAIQNIVKLNTKTGEALHQGSATFATRPFTVHIAGGYIYITLGVVSSGDNTSSRTGVWPAYTDGAITNSSNALAMGSVTVESVTQRYQENGRLYVSKEFDQIPEEYPNLFPQGTMEDDTPGVWEDINTPVTNERSTDFVHGGTYSRKCVCDSNFDGIQSALLDYPTEDGVQYVLRGWVYSETPITILQRLATSGGNFDISVTVPAGEWTMYENTWTSNSISTLARWQISSGVGTFYIDDVTIQRTTDATQALSTKQLILERDGGAYGDGVDDGLTFPVKFSNTTDFSFVVIAAIEKSQSGARFFSSNFDLMLRDLGGVLDVRAPGVGGCTFAYPLPFYGDGYHMTAGIYNSVTGWLIQIDGVPMAPTATSGTLDWSLVPSCGLLSSATQSGCIEGRIETFAMKDGSLGGHAELTELYNQWLLNKSSLVKFGASPVVFGASPVIFGE